MVLDERPGAARLRFLEELFTRADVDYLQVNSTTAGCFTFRIERA